MMPVIIMILVSEVLHRWLDWQLWVGVAIVCLIATGPPLARLLGDSAVPVPARMTIAFQAIMGTLFAAVLAYVPMVTMHYWMHNPSW
jgi:hypothetical protein